MAMRASACSDMNWDAAFHPGTNSDGNRQPIDGRGSSVVLWPSRLMKTTQTTAALTAIALMVLAQAASSEESFDGKWLTTVSCEAARDALGYSLGS